MDFFNHLVFGWLTLFRMAADEWGNNPSLYQPPLSDR
jgi:hypothetical protein